jgi:hypothetical protein
MKIQALGANSLGISQYMWSLFITLKNITDWKLQENWELN